MASKLPYMLSVGLIPKIFEKAQNARRPERFTQDFLETKLGHSGGAARPIISLLKRMSFLNSDGSPTALYDQFRNTGTQGAAIAQGVRIAFSEIFERNEYAYELSRDKMTSLVVEITGGTKEDSKTKAIVGTFWALKELADFDADTDKTYTEPVRDGQREVSSVSAAPGVDENLSKEESANVEFRVGYTINLNLPETTDPDVFNAIFRALKDNLLRN